MSLKNEEIEANKNLFIDILQGVKYDFESGDLDGLIDYLCNESDFFIAPASTKYHNSFKGGLCQHSLNVYYNLKSLVEMKGLNNKISNNSIVITALLHDISKTNFYEETVVNKKVYSENGSKSDSMGKFDWVSEPGYKVVDDHERFLFADHGQNSVRMIESFIPLTTEEACAITNHHSVYDNPNLSVTPIYDRFTLAALLHIADMLATYVDERIREDR